MISVSFMWPSCGGRVQAYSWHQPPGSSLWVYCWCQPLVFTSQARSRCQLTLLPTPACLCGNWLKSWWKRRKPLRGPGGHRATCISTCHAHQLGARMVFVLTRGSLLNAHTFQCAQDTVSGYLKITQCSDKRSCLIDDRLQPRAFRKLSQTSALERGSEISLH